MRYLSTPSANCGCQIRFGDFWLVSLLVGSHRAHEIIVAAQKNRWPQIETIDEFGGKKKQTHARNAGKE